MNLENIEETWKPINGFSRYNVSNLGRIINVETSHILKFSISIHGYKRYALTNEFGLKVKALHRIIYESFIGELKENMVIDHIDRNKLNNSIENLRQCSKSTNAINSNDRKIMYGIFLLEEKIIIFDNCALVERICPSIKSKNIRRCEIYNNILFGEYSDFENIFLNKINFCEEINIKKELFIKNIKIKDTKDIRSFCPNAAIDKNNRKYLFRNLPEFAKIYNLDTSGINKCLKGTLKT